MDYQIKDLNKILKKYWNYNQFRYPQKEIILELLEGNDILALMPTGGGKSVCFQIPALIKSGICIVVSPLLSLIKDQIEKLWSQGIKAASISSSMSNREIDIVLDNCIYGNIKLLYISPERIRSQLFIERFKKMDVNLIAVDEAHCISQWGYDFRPSYLKITELRTLKPDVNIIALTASANKSTRLDIIEKLNFKSYKEFKISFRRDNIIYQAQKAENKNYELVRLLKGKNSSIIIYTDTRKKTKEIFEYLRYHKINADFYHAGMDIKERERKQKSWTNEKIKIIITTKAFGMGIDKSNVRYVIHMSPPATIEDYYQESGRAGRDQKNSEAIIFYNESDIYELKNKLEKKYPRIEYIKNIYNKIGNYLNIAFGSGKMISYNFDLDNFINIYKFNYFEAYNAIKILERQGFLKFNFNEDSTQDKILIKISPNELYRYRINNKYHDKVIETILRLYGGEIFIDFCKISKTSISKKNNLRIEEIKRILNQLHKQEIIDYKPKSDLEQITFIIPRENNNYITLKSNDLKKRKNIEKKKLDSIINYLENGFRCRTQIILEYFDEIDYEKCNKCDNCKKNNLTNIDINYEKEIIQCIKDKISDPNEIINKVDPKQEDLVIKSMRLLLKKEKIQIHNNKLYSIDS